MKKNSLACILLCIFVITVSCYSDTQSGEPIQNPGAGTSSVSSSSSSNGVPPVLASDPAPPPTTPAAPLPPPATTYQPDGVTPPDQDGVTPQPATTPVDLPVPIECQGPNFVIFRIGKVGAGGAWNSNQNPITATVGQSICIINDDDVEHLHHTTLAGEPCSHPDPNYPMGPGDFSICVTQRPYVGVLYDHHYQHIPTAEVWWNVTEAP